MAKIKTNEQMFRDFAKNGDSVLIAIARATMVSNAEKIVKNREQVIADHANSMFGGELIVQAAEEVVKYLGFEVK